MTIYIIDPAKLDDETLVQQVRLIVQTLCNVHYIYWDDIYPSQLRNHKSGLNLLGIEQAQHCLHMQAKIPLPPEGLTDPDAMTNWALACLSNYLILIHMGYDILWEQRHRFFLLTENQEYWPILNWLRDNVPDLPEVCVDENKIVIDPPAIPFLIPNEYIEYLSSTVREGSPRPIDFEQSYINYYRANLPKNPVWTKRSS